MSRDVNDGPLSQEEHFLLRQAVKEQKGQLMGRVVTMLLLETGARPIQLIHLEEQDLIVNSGAKGYVFYSLNIPRAKQGHVGEPDKKRRRISPELRRSIQELIKRNHSYYGQRAQMPILCIKSVSRKKLTRELKPRYELHLKVAGFTGRLARYADKVGIISTRTGKPLKLHSLRLRYTFFTMLAEQGAATNHLAELADHSNDKSIGVYVSNTSSVVDRLNAALGRDPHYSQTIARFLGEIVRRKEDNENSVILGSTPTLKNLGGIGVCGANFLCDLYPPLSCYVCPKFQAWVDGPHEELLQELEAFVQSLIEKSANQSDRIPYQLIDVITALRQLLVRIEEMKNGKKDPAARNPGTSSPKEHSGRG